MKNNISSNVIDEQSGICLGLIADNPQGNKSLLQRLNGFEREIGEALIQSRSDNPAALKAAKSILEWNSKPCKSRKIYERKAKTD